MRARRVSSWRVCARALAAFTCLLAAPHLVVAANCTWTGNGPSDNWSNAANWNNCGGAHATPISGDSVIFPAGANRAHPIDDIAGLSIPYLQMNGPAASGDSFVISPGVGITITLTGVIEFRSQAVFTQPVFDVPIVLGDVLTVLNTGSILARLAAINLNGSTLQLWPTTASLVVAGIISGSGTIAKYGQETLFLNGANSFVGPMNINEGIVVPGNNMAFGDVSVGTTVAAGAQLRLESGVTVPEPLTLNGGLLVSGGLNTGNTWSGPVTLTADSFLSVTLPLTMTGAISGHFALVKDGGGTVILSGNSPAFTGRLVQRRGTFLVNGNLGNCSVSVEHGTFGGTGTAGSVVALNDSTINPGGILNIGNLTLNAGSSFAVHLNGATAGTGYDQLNVTGTVTLVNATLQATLGFTPQQNTVFTIIKNAGPNPVVGTFAGLPEGAPVTIGGTPFAISYVGGSGRDVTLATRIPARYFLSEGATGGFFDEDVLIANPNTIAAPVSLTFLTPSGSPVVFSSTLPAQSRTTLHINQIPGLDAKEVSTVVTSTAGLPVAVERSMFWDKTHYAGHTGSSVEGAAQDWVFAEGSQGFFNTYVLLANANATPVDVTLTFLRESDMPVVKTITVAASARVTVDCGAIPQIVNRSFGITVHGTQPIIAERAMYFGSTPSRVWSGGHESAGVTAASRSWFMAEGATGGFFDTFVLLSNPQSSTATVTVRFLLDTGATITETKTIPANQRLTINIGAEPDPRLKNAAVSTVVTSDVPIVAERSMYWKGDVFPWGEAHNSFGVVEAGTRWGLAEGRIGGPLNFHTYILLANPQTTAAAVTVTFLRETGAPIVRTYTVPPTSRFNIDVNAVSPDMHDESMGADVRVTNGVPIVVERSLYWDWHGVFFKGGTNATGVRLP